MIKNVLIVAFGGAAGSALRYLFYLLLLNIDSKFPFATLIVNIIGCFCAGVILGFGLKLNGLPEFSKLALLTGFCGGLTTFSAFTADSFMLLQNAQYGNYVLSLSANIIITLLAFFLGLQVVKLI